MICQYRWFPMKTEEAGFNNIKPINKRIRLEGSIIQLGIQALPGTKIYINENDQYLVIGNAGCFQIDAANSLPISSVEADVSNYGTKTPAGIIFDIICTDKEGVKTNE